MTGPADDRSPDAADGLPSAPGRARLLALPRAERHAALAELVGAEFRRALLMAPTDDLPFDDNYFDLGLTSLKASEVRQRLEDDLGCEFDTSVLFSASTVRQIVEHLADLVLPGTADDCAPVPTDPAAVPRHLVDDLLQDLYNA